ncbi:putative ribonuclease H-like domain-containing protein, partial [Tanacetum coccineum]
IVEQEVKGTTSSSSSLNSQNMAFVSSPSNTNEVNTAYGVSTANTQVSLASTQVSTASTQVSTANLSDATVYAFFANQPNGSQLVHEDLEQIHKYDLEEMDLKCSRRTINVEEISFKAMLAIDGAGFDWSFMADEEVPIDMALMAFSDSEANYNYYQRERMVSGNNYTRVNYNYSNKKAHPSAHRNIVPRAVLMKTGLRPLNTARPVNTAHPKTIVYSARPMGKVNTARPKAVNTARPNTTVVNAVRANQGHPQKEDQGYVDSGCSRHMTGNMSYLSDFKEFDGGYVTFGGGAKGGRITGKGTLKTSKLDFKDVYFVKELQFNLFSVSQMCEKKNSVLFTDTACFVLSPDFKLADESHVLLKVPRKNNMYSVDMKNIIPKESLTCLVAKATLDESMLWHRKLGHTNFKNINKLVKDNLVRDLFGPTFVSSLMHNKYGLVVTDDYSRFTWVFFLASKDETTGILKKFITEIENLVDNKVNIIRCDNGTDFKNSVMNNFYEMKCIRREFSIARTPHQNGVAERRNRTLIKDVCAE